MFTVTKSKRQALVIDSRKCIDCKACVVACRAENSVPLGKSRNWLNQELKVIGLACSKSPNPSSASTVKIPPVSVFVRRVLRINARMVSWPSIRPTVSAVVTA